MAGLVPFVLAAALAQAAPAGVQSAEPVRGARVQATATVVILRAETATEVTRPGGLARHVAQRSDGSRTIIFE